MAAEKAGEHSDEPHTKKKSGSYHWRSKNPHQEGVVTHP